MALLIGLAMVSVLGVVHHFGLTALRAIVGNKEQHSHRSIVVAFVGLLVLHTLEIICFAIAYLYLTQWAWIGGFGGSYQGTWDDLLYLSGINFATLGYSQIEAFGPIRIIFMMQSLGGFMVLTWSATFLYSVCEKVWRS